MQLAEHRCDAGLHTEQKVISVAVGVSYCETSDEIRLEMSF